MILEIHGPRHPKKSQDFSLRNLATDPQVGPNDLMESGNGPLRGPRGGPFGAAEGGPVPGPPGAECQNHAGKPKGNLFPGCVLTLIRLDGRLVFHAVPDENRDFIKNY